MNFSGSGPSRGMAAFPVTPDFLLPGSDSTMGSLNGGVNGFSMPPFVGEGKGDVQSSNANRVQTIRDLQRGAEAILQEIRQLTNQARTEGDRTLASAETLSVSLQTLRKRFKEAQLAMDRCIAQEEANATARGAAEGFPAREEASEAAQQISLLRSRRERELLQGLVSEFRGAVQSCQNAIAEATSRARLFNYSRGGSFGQSGASGANGSDRTREERHLLADESAKISVALQMVDDTLNQARATYSNLAEQSRTLRFVGSKMGQIPALATRVGKTIRTIRRTKARQTLVVAGVAGVCLFLCLVYWWSK